MEPLIANTGEATGVEWSADGIFGCFVGEVDISGNQSSQSDRAGGGTIIKGRISYPVELQGRWITIRVGPDWCSGIYELA